MRGITVKLILLARLLGDMTCSPGDGERVARRPPLKRKIISYCPQESFMFVAVELVLARAHLTSDTYVCHDLSTLDI